MQRPDIARTRAREVENTFEDSHGGFTIQGSDVGSGFFEPFDLKRRRLLGRRQVSSADAEFSQNFIHRDSFASALFEPCFAVPNAPAVFVGYWFIVGGSGRDRCCNGVEHGFEKSANRGNLTGRETVYQFVHLLLLVKEVGGHAWSYCTAVAKLRMPDPQSPLGRRGSGV